MGSTEESLLKEWYNGFPFDSKHRAMINPPSARKRNEKGLPD